MKDADFYKLINVRLSPHQAEFLKTKKIWWDEGYRQAIADAAKVVDDIWERNKNCDPEAACLLEESIGAIRALLDTGKEKL